MKLDDFLNKYVADGDDYLKNKMESPQYDLSNSILGLEAKLNMSQSDIAKYLNIKLDTLLSVESADLNIPVKTYENIINKLLDKLSQISEWNPTQSKFDYSFGEETEYDQNYKFYDDKEFDFLYTSNKGIVIDGR